MGYLIDTNVWSELQKGERDLVLVTRNVRDIERSGVRWLNPFEEVAS